MENASRLKFLIDGDEYFSAFASAVERARQQVLILGWDFHSGTRLRVPIKSPNRNCELGDFLCGVLSRNRELKIRILIWDFSMLFAFERDWQPLLGYGPMRRHKRLECRFDNEHPIGASHHQKIVVIDDSIAFVGGVDLTQRRWDTTEHRGEDDGRRDPSGRPYEPFHDVQAMLEGSAAAALGELARARWLRATKRNIPSPRRSSDAWPESLVPDVEEVSVGIARTEPATSKAPGAREVEVLYRDAIRAARRFVYVENQYFTSGAIAEELEAVLRRPNGPEVLLVLPRGCSGWLEESTMGLLRSRLLNRLRRADRHGRFRACYPVTEGDFEIQVHAKVLVVDDRIARVGSSNLSNRSLGFDTECDIAIEALDSERVRNAIVRFRNRLMAEHMGVTEQQLEEVGRVEGAAFRTIDGLSDQSSVRRSLRSVPSSGKRWDVFVPAETIVDPDDAETPKRAAQEFVRGDLPASTRHPFVQVLVVALVLTGLAAVWRFTSLGTWIEPERIAEWTRSIQNHPLAALWVVVTYILASLVMVPITGLILATALAFPMWSAIAYSTIGALTASLTGFWIGQSLARDTVRRLAGTRLHRISELLGRGGTVAVIALRILPVAPFTVGNLVAGASHIRCRDFTIGTVLGLVPGILALNLFTAQAWAVVREPGPVSVVLLLAAIGATATGVALVRRSLTKFAGRDA